MEELDILPELPLNHSSAFGNDTSSYFSDVYYSETELTYKGRQELIIIAFSFIIGLGTITNILSIVVFLTKEMRAVPAYVIYAILAIIDTVVLVCIVGDQWLNWLTNVTLTSKSRAYCIAYHVIGSLLLDFATLLAISVALFHCDACCLCRHFRLGSIKCLRCARHALIVLWTVVLAAFSVCEVAYIGRHTELLYSEKFGHFCLSRSLYNERITLIYAEISALILTCAYSVQLFMKRRNFAPYQIQDDANNDINNDGESYGSNVATQLHLTVLIFLVTFLLTHAPLTTSILSFTFGYIAHHHLIIFDLATFLYWSYFAVKFLVYVSTASDFRRNLSGTITARFSRSRNHEFIAMTEP